MKKTKIKIYLDTSVYNRPFDYQGQTRIRLETEAFLSILEKAVSGTLIIMGSSAVLYENSRNPFADRRERISSYLSVVSKFTGLNDHVKKTALLLEGINIDPIDALHLAYAESGGAEYFITCDNDIMKRITRHKGILKTEACNPLEFVLKEVFKNA
ncbi:MAG: PIN domain-containing protein [Deltaproteobacteria bacterium]|nr:PIN domain-containing protein [Deltaproteobacteria bacterium]